jgi:hypothetical protein
LDGERREKLIFRQFSLLTFTFTLTDNESPINSALSLIQAAQLAMKEIIERHSTCLKSCSTMPIIKRIPVNVNGVQRFKNSIVV